ncbi:MULTISPECIES: hypothetical protein [Cyanophyceae]|uniref:hypothetical protein n=1 Tax=Cyanophyceae TaxID=3028117 RepID=UPI001683089F|nr:hypothetical protein [Trichocoleus sp. FACHB-40]MBD2001900.1 hypothetical protein [Trichocoleus sp. FACHB-40]
MDEIIPEEVSWVARSQARKLLNISDAQLRRDQSVLLELKTTGFDYKRCDKGFTRDSLLALWEFRKLIQLKGRSRAIAEINSTMEQYYERS